MDNSHKQKFNNIISELEYLKKKCEILEKDLFKSRVLNKKQETIIAKLQDKLNLLGKNTNNTSNTFLLPSEFKSQWEQLVKDIMLDAFDSIMNDYKYLSFVVQNCMKIIYLEAETKLIATINQLLNHFNINLGSTNIIKDILPKIRNFLQEYYSSIFTCSDKTIKEIGEKIIKLCLENEFEVEDLKKDIENEYFFNFVIAAFKLNVYLLLHEPELKLSEIKTPDYRYFKKSLFLPIEGFCKEESICCIILNPPLLRNNFVYQGIFPAVYIIQSPTQEIIEECKNNTIESKFIIEDKELLQSNHLHHSKSNSTYSDFKGINSNHVAQDQATKNMQIFTSSKQSNFNNITLTEKENKSSQITNAKACQFISTNNDNINKIYLKSLSNLNVDVIVNENKDKLNDELKRKENCRSNSQNFCVLSHSPNLNNPRNYFKSFVNQQGGVVLNQQNNQSTLFKPQLFVNLQNNKTISNNNKTHLTVNNTITKNNKKVKVESRNVSYPISQSNSINKNELESKSPDKMKTKESISNNIETFSFQPSSARSNNIILNNKDLPYTSNINTNNKIRGSSQNKNTGNIIKSSSKYVSTHNDYQLKRPPSVKKNDNSTQIPSGYLLNNDNFKKVNYQLKYTKTTNAGLNGSMKLISNLTNTKSNNSMINNNSNHSQIKEIILTDNDENKMNKYEYGIKQVPENYIAQSGNNFNYNNLIQLGGGVNSKANEIKNKIEKYYSKIVTNGNK